MIYFLSDLHGEFFSELREYLSQDHQNDLLILLGDIGLRFENTEDNRMFTEEFLTIKSPVAIVDGNHENFDFLYDFPEEAWNGGMVHRLSEHIVHLKRGNLFNIEGKTFFVFGGCRSSAKWQQMGLWYPQEEATKEEIALAYDNLERCGHQVDYVLTHKYQRGNDGQKDIYSLQGLTDFIDEQVEFKRWYAGHWHRYEEVDDRHICIYDRLISLGK